MSPREKALYALDTLTTGVRQVATKRDVANNTVSATAAILFGLAGATKFCGLETVSGIVTAGSLVLFTYAAVNEYGIRNTQLYFSNMYNNLFSKGHKLSEVAPAPATTNDGFATPEEDDKPKMQ